MTRIIIDLPDDMDGQGLNERLHDLVNDYMEGRFGSTITYVKPGEHVYLSTGCLHGNHEHCRCTETRQGAPKTPGVCKFCSSPCICPCHSPAGEAQTTDGNQHREPPA